MKLIYEGKTKKVYALPNGNLLLKFTDDMTGKDGVFDPGENQVGLTVEGSGKAGLALTKFFFEALNDKGIKTHYINATIEDKTMEVKKAYVFGKGLEVICRYKAVGSFFKRYQQYVTSEQDLHGFVEITIKDDNAQDPTISKEALALLNIATNQQYDDLVAQTKQISQIIFEILKEKGLDLYDIKLEFGIDEDNNVILIDEISGGNMRVYKNGEYLLPLELTELVLN